ETALLDLGAQLRQAAAGEVRFLELFLRVRDRTAGLPRLRHLIDARRQPADDLPRQDELVCLLEGAAVADQGGEALTRRPHWLLVDGAEGGAARRCHPAQFRLALLLEVELHLPLALLLEAELRLPLVLWLEVELFCGVGRRTVVRRPVIRRGPEPLLEVKGRPVGLLKVCWGRPGRWFVGRAPELPLGRPVAEQDDAEQGDARGQRSNEARHGQVLRGRVSSRSSLPGRRQNDFRRPQSDRAVLTRRG